MPRLFIFAIGGTGSRVLKALSMLLASGVDIKADKIIPIIIDPDSTNGDLARTMKILKLYQDIHKSADFQENKFFKTSISTLKSLSDEGSSAAGMTDVFKFKIDGSQEGRFRNVIDYSTLDESNKALIDALYSDRNLNLSLNEGFKGHPNIGAVVLNMFQNSPEFTEFSSSFQADDRIFIISSIFGGTGAAGFPLILKNLRNADPAIIPNAQFLRDAHIGAVTVMPYFGVTPTEGGVIDRDTFISKTKAALSYYKRNIVDNKSINALYYLGDEIKSNYDYSEGQESQKNKAHFIEFVSAMAIIDFMEMSKDDLETGEVVAKEYGLKDNANTLNFTHLPNRTFDKTFKQLTQYTYFNLYLAQNIHRSIGKHPWSKRGKVKIDSNFVKNNRFYRDYVQKFNKHYWDWLTEMSTNERGFRPFEMATAESTLYRLTHGIEQKKSFWSRSSWDYDYFDAKLNEVEKQLGDSTVEAKFLDMFYLATKAIMEEKYK